MNTMEALSLSQSASQLYPQVAFLDPNIYYSSFFPKNIPIYNSPITSQEKVNNKKNNNNKETPKKINTIEISLISLLNAISEFNESNINSEKTEKSDEINKEDNLNIMELLTQKTKRNIKYCNACPHHNAPHYAKGMCSNCYHSRGRQKKPWNCPHSNKFHYALGLCQNCYQMRYMKNIKDDGSKIQEGENIAEEIDNGNNNEIVTNSAEKKSKKGPGRHSKNKKNK